MKIFEVIQRKRLWGGLNGNKIPDDIKLLIAKHVKTSVNDKKYISLTLTNLTMQFHQSATLFSQE